MIIEVFKTDLNDRNLAEVLIEEMQKEFVTFEINFDLEDSDHILRVKSTDETIESSPIIEFLNKFGIQAEVLPDIVPPVNSKVLTL